MSLTRNEMTEVVSILENECRRLDSRMKKLMMSDSSIDEYKGVVNNLNRVKKLVEKIKKENII
tara:strand:- start:214 stop:402 length:189 start_codon:yes stop_codon:yes gene_type:complete